MLQLPFEGKKILQSKKLFLLFIVKITTRIEEKKCTKTVLSGYKKYEYILKFLAPSGDTENHLPLLTILKCSQESWFLEKDKRKGSKKI